MDSLLAAHNAKDIKMVIIHRKDIALAFGVMYIQRNVIILDDPTMDRKVSSIAVLMISQ